MRHVPRKVNARERHVQIITFTIQVGYLDSLSPCCKMRRLTVEQGPVHVEDEGPR